MWPAVGTATTTTATITTTSTTITATMTNIILGEQHASRVESDNGKESCQENSCVHIGFLIAEMRCLVQLGVGRKYPF